MINTARMASSSYTKLFFPCSEDGPDVDIVDVIGTVTQSETGVQPGTGLYINAPFDATSEALGSGVFPTIAATSDFMIFSVVSNSNITGNITFGDNLAGQRCFPFLQSGAVEIHTATESVIFNEPLTDATAITGYAMVCKRGEDLEYHDGPTVNSPSSVNKRLTEAFTPAAEMVLGFSYIYGMAIFEFVNGIPSDYVEAIAWMAPRWAVGQKVIWHAWVNK